jgi:hypothetical protein
MSVTKPIFTFSCAMASGLARPAAASMHDRAVSFAFIRVSFALMSWVLSQGHGRNAAGEPQAPATMNIRVKPREAR